MHYAGVACEMDPIVAIAKHHGLRVVEDAAQGIMASYKGTPLGAIGDLGSFSFHETKNIMSRFGRTHGDLPLTVDLSERLIRLPFWIGLDEARQQRICDTLSAILGQ
nr:DegT/DnrJ/EryC1/StrS family aminotransferase [Bradyrhizobium diazoefficiens]